MSRFKAWLKRSGIRYVLAGRHRLQGTEMIDSLNPFDEIIDIPDAPWTVIHQQDFFERIAATFNVLLGDHYDMFLRGGGRIGVIDFLVFPLIGRRLMAYTSDERNNSFLRVASGVLAYPLEIGRGALGVALTIALSPIVALVHAAVFIRNQVLGKRIRNLNLQNTTVTGNAALASSLVASPQKSLKVENVCNEYQKTFGNSFCINLSTYDGKVISSDGCIKATIEDQRRKVKINTDIAVTPENREGLEAMVEANIFCLATKLNRANQFSLFRELTRNPVKMEQPRADDRKSDRDTKSTPNPP